MGVEDSAAFGPRRGRLWRRAALFLVSGGAALAALRGGGPHPLAALAAPVLLAAALTTLLALARGRPRLEVNPDGLTLRRFWRTTTVAWDRIGAFALAGPAGRTRAVAPWLARARGRPGGDIVLRDVFDTPLPLLLDMIAVRRPHTPGLAAPPPPERPCGVPGFRAPWLTAAILAVLVAVFAAERQAAAVLGTAPGAPGSPSLATLVALGGSSRVLVESGQWHRLLSAPLLHAGAAHLMGNAAALVLAGWTLERLVGRAWMACIFAIGALGGSLASLALSPPATVTVGASGAIMALLAALLFVSIRMPAGHRKVAIQVQSARVAIPALLPLGHGGAVHVDYGAHLGGASVGLVLGGLLLRSWRDDRPLPDLRGGAAVLAAVAAVAFVASGAAVARHYADDPTVRAGLIPNARLPHDAAAAAATIDALLLDYPRDPRAHLLSGGQHLSRGELAGAEREFRLARTLLAPAPKALPPQLAATIQASLAVTLLAQRRLPEALDAAAPACIAAGAEALSPSAAAALARASLCPHAASPGPPAP